MKDEFTTKYMATYCFEDCSDEYTLEVDGISLFNSVDKIEDELKSMFTNWYKNGKLGDGDYIKYSINSVRLSEKKKMTLNVSTLFEIERNEE